MTPFSGPERGGGTSIIKQGEKKIREGFPKVRRTQEGCGGLGGENPAAFPKSRPIFQQPFSLPENAQTLAGIAFRAAGKLVKNFPAASKFAGNLFQHRISDSHSLLEFSDKGPKIEKFQSRLKFSISLEMFNPDLQNSPQKIGFWWVARLKFSISLENFKISQIFSIFGPLGLCVDGTQAKDWEGGAEELCFAAGPGWPLCS